MRKATHLALMLLLAAGLGAFAASAEAQSAPEKKSAVSNSLKKSHRKKVSRKLRRWEKGQKVPAPDRITEIQQALAKDGSFSGTPSGKLDAKTLQKLGLGSQTAGVAAPLPPTSSLIMKSSAAQTARRRQ